MRTLTTAQMREADRRCIEEIGIPGAVLMSNAGTAVFREITKGPAGVVCGKGNNGGDGFVVARLCHLAGLDTRTILLASPEEIVGDAAIFLHAYRRLGGELTVTATEDELRAAMVRLHDCAVVVDAMLGTGISGDVRGLVRCAIDNWPKRRTIAVDVPSGLDSDEGTPCGCCVKADVTVTFQFAKIGLVQSPARPYVGRLVVADIGIPSVCADDAQWVTLRQSWRP